MNILKKILAVFAVCMTAHSASASDEFQIYTGKSESFNLELREGQVGIVVETYKWHDDGFFNYEGRVLVKTKMQYLDRNSWSMENNEILPQLDIEIIPLKNNLYDPSLNYIRVTDTARIYRDIYSGNNFSILLKPSEVSAYGVTQLADLKSAGVLESFMKLSCDLVGARYTNLRSEGHFIGMELVNSELSVGFNWNLTDSVKIRIEGGASIAAAYGLGVNTSFGYAKGRWFSEQKTFARIAALISQNLALTFEAGKRGINGNRHTNYVQFGASWKM